MTFLYVIQYFKDLKLGFLYKLKKKIEEISKMIGVKQLLLKQAKGPPV